MKYNKSEIMKNAWTIRRTETINMSSALKKAWAMVKNKGGSKMFITITDRYMSKEQLLARHGIPYLSCGDAYEKKDVLKAMGYRFNSTNKHWEIKIDPAHFMDLCAETAIACNLSVSELENFLAEIGAFSESPRSNGFCNEFTVDDLDERYNAYCDRIGY